MRVSHNPNATERVTSVMTSIFFRQVLYIERERMAALSTSSVMYFNLMLHFCNDDRLRLAMIRGLITSASSGGEALLSAARLAISRFLTMASPADADVFYDSLLAVIRSEMPTGRLLWPGMEVLAFVLDTDVVPQDSTNNEAAADYWSSSTTLFLPRSSSSSSSSTE